MFCRACGNLLVPGARFCSACSLGTSGDRSAVPPYSPTVVLPACASSEASPMPYCVQCGVLREIGNPCNSCLSDGRRGQRSAVLCFAMCLSVLACGSALAVGWWDHRYNGVWSFVGICFLPHMLVSLILLAKDTVSQMLAIKRTVGFSIPLIGSLAEKCSALI